MDAKVRKAVLDKINETVSNAGEISQIVQSLNISVENRSDFALGVAIGRIYNSFHYQTRRTLKRNATEEEFDEFLGILAKKTEGIKKALKQQ
ncbi:MAG: hypothetical protein AB1351_05410 [Thermoproteota archaeon]